ncbi:MAG: Nif3-like dinuclear metal center hexameric protein [Bacteroidota bacterium]
MRTNTIKEIISHLESLAPLSSQETYDNCGLLIGDYKQEVKNLLISLDCTEEIIDEAIAKKCELIVSHHPIIFKGLNKITGSNYIERTILKAIKNNIAIYAIHTNLDNYRYGVNYEISRRLGLTSTKILLPKEHSLSKLVVYIPTDYSVKVSDALFEAGAGKIGNYSECHFNSNGTGTYKPNTESNPFEGKIEIRSTVDEVKAEFLVENSLLSEVIRAMNRTHPYEEVAYDLIPLLNKNSYLGSGMIGELNQEISEDKFLELVKSTFNCGVIRYTSKVGKSIKKVAVCGGAGSFLIHEAIKQKADVFLTSDLKYHEFFEADNLILLIDIGHYESEQFTKDLIADILKKKFSKFAVHLTEKSTNPINYL